MKVFIVLCVLVAAVTGQLENLVNHLTVSIIRGFFHNSFLINWIQQNKDLGNSDTDFLLLFRNVSVSGRLDPLEYIVMLENGEGEGGDFQASP